MPEGTSDKQVAQAAVPEQSADIFPPWEMIENGRYMPRRIRGSFPGRELG